LAPSLTLAAQKSQIAQERECTRFVGAN